MTQARHRRVVYKKWQHYVHWMFHFLLDYEADIQHMAEADEQNTVYITLEALLQRFGTINPIYVRSHLLSPGQSFGDLQLTTSQPEVMSGCVDGSAI